MNNKKSHVCYHLGGYSEYLHVNHNDAKVYSVCTYAYSILVYVPNNLPCTSPITFHINNAV